MSTTWLLNALSLKPVRYTAIACAILVTFITLFQLKDGYSHNSQLLNNWRSGASKFSASEGPLGDVFNATLGFEKILAINLPERTDHRDGLILAAAVSGLQIEFVDGVHGDTIIDKALPIKHKSDMIDAHKGAWRAHINAISRVVEHNWTSALIMEDDVDWDIRLKSQIQNVAIASQYLTTADRPKGLVRLEQINSAPAHKTSPFGEGWDVLWLGHCGMKLPDIAESTIVLLEDDETVPETEHYASWDEKATPPLADFPQHSRAIMQQHQGTCSLAYAVSQQGARKLLFSLGLRRLDMAFDLMLREWCQGLNGNEEHICIGTLPQLFDHHRRVGPAFIDSDISDHTGDDKIREKAFTMNIRWSVRMNMEKLLKGEENYIDQWPDEARS